MYILKYIAGSKHFLALISSYAVYVAFKISAVEKRGDYKLFVGWYAAGIKSKFFFKQFRKLLGKNHITDSQGG